MKIFKIYVVISLFIIMLLLGTLVGTLVYGSQKIKSESSTITDKVNSFNTQVDGINKNLSDITSQLQTVNTKLSQKTILP